MLGLGRGLRDFDGFLEALINWIQFTDGEMGARFACDGLLEIIFSCFPPFCRHISSS